MCTYSKIRCSWQKFILFRVVYVRTRFPVPAIEDILCLLRNQHLFADTYVIRYSNEDKIMEKKILCVIVRTKCIYVLLSIFFLHTKNVSPCSFVQLKILCTWDPKFFTFISTFRTYLVTYWIFCSFFNGPNKSH